MSMLKQFQQILFTPRPSSKIYLERIKDNILNALQGMFNENYDFTQLSMIFQQQQIKRRDCNQMNQNEKYNNNDQNLTELVYKLIGYFIRVINENFINLYVYNLLQEQTQKLQATIRGHIKMQQQMKMYLQHLEYKIERYEFHFNRLKTARRNGQNYYDKGLYCNIKQYQQGQLNDFNDNIELLKIRQTKLLKQRLELLNKVQYLQRRLKNDEIQLRRLNSPISSSIRQIKESFINKDNEKMEVKNRQNCNDRTNEQQYYKGWDYLVNNKQEKIDSRTMVKGVSLTLQEQVQQYTLSRRISSSSYSSLLTNNNDLITQKKSSVILLHPHNCLLTSKQIYNKGSDRIEGK